MAPTIAPLPQFHEEDAEPWGTGQYIAWTALLGLAFWPRLWILGFWIFGHQLGDAFSNWLIPAAGFCVLPWTTMMYGFMWGITSHGVSGLEWIVVGASLLLDLAWWAWGLSALR